MKIFLKKKVLLPIISVFAFVLSLVWAFASTPNVYAATTVVEVATLTKEIMLNNMTEYQYGELYGGKVTINGINFRWNRMLPSGNNLTLPSNYDNYFIAEGLDQTISLLDISMTFGNTNSGNLVFDVSDRFVFNESLSGKTGYSKYNVAATGYNRSSVCLLFDRTGDSPETELIVTSLTLTLKAEVTTDKVTLDKQSGSGGSSSIDAAPGSAMPSITVPTRTGYTFGGYYTGTNGSGTKYYNADGSSATNWVEGAATTLYAKWTAKTYTVTLDRQSGTGGSSSVTATYNSAMPSMTKPTRTGYTFGGYYTGTNGGGTQYYNANGGSVRNWDKTSNTTLYAKWTLLPVIQNVIDRIDTIGTVTYPNSKSLINTARDAYDALDNSYKTLVSNYETLTTAETKYDNLKNTAVNNVKDLIDAIGVVTYPNSKNDIIAAEEAYANLDNDEKNVTTITNYETLTDARTTYDNLRDAAIAEAYDKIDVINIPLIYPNSNTELTTARTAFDKLDTDDKNDTIITNYQDLLDLEAVYSIVVEINEFGTPNVTQVFRDKVSNARNEYEELNYVQQSLFPDKELHILYNYETALVVMDIIQNIGLISYTTESKSKIDNAKESYDNLTNEQKELVTNYQVLTHDIEVYNHVDYVYKKINDIDEVKYEETSEEEINVARRSYDDLTDEEKALVVNYDKLTTDETTYKELRNDHITFVGWMIALAIMGGIILSLFIAYILLFFVFNKWTLANNKAIRVFKIGKKNDKIRLLTITLMIIYRNEDEVFNKKSDVIK
jgi:hypothetical protein